MTRKIITPADIEFICRLVKDGCHLDDVSNACGWSKPAIYRILAAAGISAKWYRKKCAGKVAGKPPVSFGDRYAREQVDSRVPVIGHYYDNVLHHDVTVYQCRYTTFSRGAR